MFAGLATARRAYSNELARRVHGGLLLLAPLADYFRRAATIGLQRVPHVVRDIATMLLPMLAQAHGAATLTSPPAVRKAKSG
jgi:hypothetical protein